MKLDQLTEILGNAEFVGKNDSDITGLNRINHASNSEITFLEDSRYEHFLSQTNAGFIIVKKESEFIPKANQVFIKVDHPYLSFLKLVNYFEPKKNFENEIHSTAVIEKSAQISPTAFIGANCYIGENTIIEDFVVIYPNTTIHNDVKIGKRTKIYSNVSIYYGTEIGENCILHSGCVIGSDGFGFQENKDGSYTKIPQIGNVLIMNDVEIGANTTIDRSFVGSTLIYNGVKLDNLIQIAHNDEIGENTAMAAQVGIAGSAIIGKRNKFGGQVGIAGHLEITDDVTLIAKSGVPKSITEKGTYYGAPVRDRLTAFKVEAAIHNLPQLVRDIAKIKKKLELD